MSFFLLTDEEEENVKNLYEEAEMPLEQVMAKYQHDHLNPNAKKIKQEDGKPPVSPFLRGRRSCSSGASSSKCSTGMLSGSGNGSTASDPDAEDKGKERDAEVSSSSTQGQCSSSSRQHLGNSEADQASDCSASNGETKSAPEAGEEMEATKHKAAMPDSSDDSKIQNTVSTADQSGDENSSFKVSDAGDVKQEVNGVIGESNKKDAEQAARDCDGVTSSSAPHENGEVVKGEIKGKSLSKASSSCDSNKEDKKHFTLRRRTETALYCTLLGNQDQSDSDSDDEGDESFQGADNR
jgi:protein phosphatase 1G